MAPFNHPRSSYKVACAFDEQLRDDDLDRGPSLRDLSRDAAVRSVIPVTLMSLCGALLMVAAIFVARQDGIGQYFVPLGVVFLTITMINRVYYFNRASISHLEASIAGISVLGLFSLVAGITWLFVSLRLDWWIYAAIIGVLLGIIIGVVVLVAVPRSVQMATLGMFLGIGADAISSVAAGDTPRTVVNSLARLVSNLAQAFRQASSATELPAPPALPLSVGLWAFVAGALFTLIIGCVFPERGSAAAASRAKARKRVVELTRTLDTDLRIGRKRSPKRQSPAASSGPINQDQPGTSVDPGSEED
jgi:hypothetical protein